MDKDDKQLFLAVPILLLEALPFILVYYLYKLFNVAPGVSVVYLLVIWIVILNFGLFVFFMFIKNKNGTPDINQSGVGENNID